jgi:hypothetical protein
MKRMRVLAAVAGATLMIGGVALVAPSASANSANMATTAATAGSAGSAGSVVAADTCTDTSATGGPIAGCMAAARAAYWKSLGIPYSQAVKSAGIGDYRADCSGFVSYALNISDTTPTDGGLVSGQMYESNGFVDVAKGNLQQGDVLTNPSSENQGHVVMFDHWADSSEGSYWGWEQTGFGTLYRDITYPCDDPNAGTFYPQHYTKLVAPQAATHLYALAPDKSYVAEWDGTAGAWHTIGGPATAIYAGGFGLFATNPNDGSINKYTGSGQAWAKIGGPGASFAVGNNALYALGPNNSYVAMWQTSWGTIGGPAGQIAAGG